MTEHETCRGFACRPIVTNHLSLSILESQPHLLGFTTVYININKIVLCNRGLIDCFVYHWCTTGVLLVVMF